MKFTTPKITLEELKKLIKELSFSKDCVDKLDFYQKEFLRHYCAVILDLKEEQSKRIYMLLSKSEEIDDRLKEISKTSTSLEKDEFEILKTKVFFLTDDLITFITDENITDRSIGDIQMNW